MDSTVNKDYQQKIAFCTIAAINYLAEVQVLANSYFNLYSQKLYVLLLDGVDESELSTVMSFSQKKRCDETIEFLQPEALNIDHNDLLNMRIIYDVMEIATALKPWLLEFLTNQNFDQIIYLDPDIVIYEPLTEVNQILTTSDIVLTPHNLQPIPRDSKLTSEYNILISGQYNLGFIGINKFATSFLDFWKERLLHDCVVDIENQLFVDQRWVDFVPSYFNSFILKNKGYNVAYWNIHERPIRSTGTKYFIGDTPLVFFHFSGFEMDHPETLSKHSKSNPRVEVSAVPALGLIMQEYKILLNDFGYQHFKTFSYGYSTMANGKHIDIYMRRAARDFLKHTYKTSNTKLPNPFDITELNKFYNFLKGSDDVNIFKSKIQNSYHLNRYQKQVFAIRADLKLTFPKACTDPDDSVLSWINTFGVNEFDPELMQPVNNIPLQKT